MLLSSLVLSLQGSTGKVLVVHKDREQVPLAPEFTAERHRFSYGTDTLSGSL